MESLNILRNGFRSGITRSLEFRKKQLKAIYKMLEVHEKDFCEAVKKDLNKSRAEFKMMELLLVKQEISVLLKNMDSWLANEKVPKVFITLTDGTWIQRQPYGVAMCIAAWNYPIFLTLMPMCGMLAAGNCVLLKPSEISVHCQQLLFDLLPKFVDQNVCQVFLGDGPQTAEILKEKFDYIFFTGSAVVGKLVMEAASRHLTPIGLEFDVKCPVYLDKEVQLKTAAKRIMWSKFACVGQTSITPGYVLCHRDLKERFVKACQEVLDEFYTADALTSPDYARVINEKSYNRLMDMITHTRGKVVRGGNGKAESLYIDPTIVELDSLDDILMKNEIFGPILPLIPVNSPEEALEIINNIEKPLAIYVFSDNRSVMNKFEIETTSGALVFNDCILHVGVPGLPFGGVGKSGMGRYKGRFSIEEFSNKRAVLDKDTKEFVNNLFRYPPYNESKEKWADCGLKSDTSDGSRACTII